MAIQETSALALQSQIFCAQATFFILLFQLGVEHLWVHDRRIYIAYYILYIILRSYSKVDGLKWTMELTFLDSGAQGCNMNTHGKK